MTTSDCLFEPIRSVEIDTSSRARGLRFVSGMCCGLHRNVVGFTIVLWPILEFSVVFAVIETSKNPSRDEILIAATSSSSPIDEQRSRDLIDPFLYNQYTSLMISFHLPLFILLYILIFSIIQNPRTTQISIHGDETKWKVSCLLLP